MFVCSESWKNHDHAALSPSVCYLCDSVCSVRLSCCLLLRGELTLLNHSGNLQSGWTCIYYFGGSGFLTVFGLAESGQTVSDCIWPSHTHTHTPFPEIKSYTNLLLRLIHFMSSEHVYLRLNQNKCKDNSVLYLIKHYFRTCSAGPVFHSLSWLILMVRLSQIYQQQQEIFHINIKQCNMTQ